MKLNKRGKRARALLILAGVVLLVWLVSSRVWYVPEVGYCFGTMANCYA